MSTSSPAAATRPAQGQAAKAVLVIEDEPDISELLEYNLLKAGFKVYLSANGEDGITQTKKYQPDLILLDIMMPKMTGFEVCRILKSSAATQHIPIVFLTAKGDEQDTVAGLDGGADDYIIKPFRTQELIARIWAHLRRYEINHNPTYPTEYRHNNGELIVQGPLALHRKNHLIFLNQTPLILTLSEFKLLSALIRAPGEVFSRAKLIAVIADKNTKLVPRNIDVHILSLRKKLGASAYMIETIRGIGYRCREVTLKTPAATQP